MIFSIITVPLKSSSVYNGMWGCQWNWINGYLDETMGYILILIGVYYIHPTLIQQLPPHLVGSHSVIGSVHESIARE